MSISLQYLRNVQDAYDSEVASLSVKIADAEDAGIDCAQHRKRLSELRAIGPSVRPA